MPIVFPVGRGAAGPEVLLWVEPTAAGTGFVDRGPLSLGLTLNGGVSASVDGTSPTGYSINFDGTNDYITSSTGSHALMTGDWTAEYIGKANDTLGTDTPLALAKGAGSYEWQIYTFTGFGSNQGSGSASWNLSGGTNSTSAFQHVAVVRDKGTMRLYVDGVQVTTLSLISTLQPHAFGSSTGYFVLGAAGNLGAFCQGDYAAFRITASARYPDGTSFTAPTTLAG